MRCPSCSSENLEGFRFCGACGAPLAALCPHCGAENPEGFRFCGACGLEIRGEAVPSAEAPTALPSERRPVTVLFADIVGFSTLAEHMDPEDLRSLMQETFAELTAEVERREGIVEKFIGDAVVAIFGAPRAHEDDPERAVESGLAMLDVVRARSASTPTPVKLRVGVNSGLVVAGKVGDGSQTGVMGDAVNLAARLQQAAEPDQVLVADAVWRRVRHRYDAEPVGALDVKGREQAVEAFRIVGMRAAPLRRQAPFVGRSDERSLLELLWSSVEKGNTHVVSVVGEPGVGKSRLLKEFGPSAAAIDMRITCGSDRAFGPFLDLVENLLGGPAIDLDDLRARAAAAGVEEETALLIGALLGLAGGPPVVRMADEQRKRQVFTGVWQFLLGASAGRPALVVLEDVHWADASSLDLLGFLLERLGGIPLMLVLTYRPGFDHVERTALRSSHTGIRLEPLTPDESLELARGFLGVGELPADLERIIASRAEGNPFFIEELLQALTELGSLAVVDGKAVLAKVEVEIPDTVQGTILARTDRLKAKERSLLQHAAVVGRSFGTELLQAVMGEEIGDSLQKLGRAQLIVAHGPDEWGFKHALIQEVMYGTLLHRQRKELHRKVAEAIEVRGGEDPGSYELLAEHYAKADVPGQARRYAVAAGDVARERMGFVEAARRYETALHLWGQGDDEGRLALLMRLGQTAYLGGDQAASRTALVEAAAGWRGLGKTLLAGEALAILGRVYWTTGEADRAAEVLDEAIELLEPAGTSPERVQALVWSSTLNMLQGRIDVSAPQASRGLAMAEELDLDAARSHLLNNLGTCEVFAGDPAGLERIRLALELAERSGDAEAIGRAYSNLPSSLSEFSENREGVELCRRGRAAMRRLGAPGFELFIASNEASMLGELGRYDEAEEICRELLGPQRGVLAVPSIVAAGLSLGTVLVRRGGYAEVRRLLDEVLPMARRLGGAEFLGPVLILEGELEAARGNPAAARQAVSEAVRIVLDTPSAVHWMRALVPAARLLPRDRAEELYERVKGFSKHPSQRAVLCEADGLIRADPDRSAKAADLYASLEVPYQEARCRLEAGHLERAAEIIERFGLANGPLGARLLELRRAD